MERIVLEVDERIAKAWRQASFEKRLELINKINIRLGRELFDYSKADFQKYLAQLRDKMLARGLTQEKLDAILNEED
jgi:hypothetical protein